MSISGTKEWWEKVIESLKQHMFKKLRPNSKLSDEALLEHIDQQIKLWTIEELNNYVRIHF